jgi:hypothetical protein
MVNMYSADKGQQNVVQSSEDCLIREAGHSAMRSAVFKAHAKIFSTASSSGSRIENLNVRSSSLARRAPESPRSHMRSHVDSRESVSAPTSLFCERNTQKTRRISSSQHSPVISPITTLHSSSPLGESLRITPLFVTRETIVRSSKACSLNLSRSCSLAIQY